MSNDLISRKYMREAIEQFFEMVKYYHPHSKGRKTIPTEEVLDIIENAPTVELTELCKSCQYLKDCETCEENERLILLCSDMSNEIARLKSMTGER